MWSRIYHMIVKEFLQLRRDRYARIRLIVPPLVQMVMFGYAATFEVHSVATALVDRDNSQESRDLVTRFTASGRFEIVAAARADADLAQLIDRGQVTVAIQIHPGFAARLRKGVAAPVQILVDGTNSNTALIALGYIRRITEQFANEYAANAVARVAAARLQTAPSVELAERPWYNPSFESRWFFVPGVIGSLMLVITVNLTAFAVVREREIGTLEQVMVTPIRSMEFILGKTLPSFLVGLIEATLITLVGILWFQVPFRGNPLVLLLGVSLFLTCTLGMGLLISTLCKTQQQAFASSFFILTPGFTLSGFSFPIASMPVVMQWLTYLNPLRYLLVVLRGTFLKGVGLGVLWPQMLAMALIGATVLSISIFRFRKSLD
ncbi:MAG TPA: ABC transporter permease [Candidatus Acidoferrales bacterium]|nr:ABC transporter permease [Candidatus Acidoferrales bacterium]